MFQLWKKKDHTKRKCRSETKPGGNEKRRTAGIKELSATDSRREGVEDDLDFLTIYKLTKEESLLNDPLMVDVEVNGKPLRMEVDTGAAVSVMGVSAFKRLCKEDLSSLEESGLTLKT